LDDLHRRFGILRHEDVLVLPVLHGKLEYADLVRRAVAELAPDAVAVELPDTLAVSIEAAVRRLPQISVILYEDAEGNPVYLPVEPADPLFEAVRSARELQLPLRLVDLDVDYPDRHLEPFPDTYSLLQIGAGAYYDAYRDAVAARPGGAPSDTDRRREAGMAHRVQQLARQHPRVLVVCGMAHAGRLCQALDAPQPAPFARTRREKVGLFNLDPASLPEVLTSFPLLAAVYERRRLDLPPEPPEGRTIPPRRRAVTEHLSLLQRGEDRAPAEEEQESLDAAMDWIARRAADPGDDPGRPVDRRLVHAHLLRCAADRYQARTGEAVRSWQMRVLRQFARNYALVEGRLLPSYYQLLIAARGAVDENFCYEAWELGDHFPWQRASAELPTIPITAEQLMYGTRRIHLRRRIPAAKRRLVPLHKRKRERRPGEWLERFDPSGLCSYPPEDLVIEDYGNYLRKKGVQVVGEENSRVEPFTTSLLDGIDVRETVRQWHTGQIYVREERRVPGGVGSVVIVLDPDLDDSRYPFRMTWLGENDQESDMAFYSTGLLDHVVGPGINRCEYGGLMLSYPPLRVFDVWEDPDYQAARGKPEVLLMAAIDYSLDPHVVYVAADPPRSALRTYAERRARKIVYVPIGQLSPASLRRIRTFHVLWGRDKREIAKDFIW